MNFELIIFHFNESVDLADAYLRFGIDYPFNHDLNWQLKTPLMNRNCVSEKAVK